MAINAFRFFADLPFQFYRNLLSGIIFKAGILE